MAPPHRLRARQTASNSSRSGDSTSHLVLAQTADEPNAGGVQGRKRRRAGLPIVERGDAVARRELAGQLAREEVAREFQGDHPLILGLAQHQGAADDAYDYDGGMDAAVGEAPDDRPAGPLADHPSAVGDSSSELGPVELIQQLTRSRQSRLRTRQGQPAPRSRRVRRHRLWTAWSVALPKVVEAYLSWDGRGRPNAIASSSGLGVRTQAHNLTSSRLIVIEPNSEHGHGQSPAVALASNGFIAASSRKAAQSFHVSLLELFLRLQDVSSLSAYAFSQALAATWSINHSTALYHQLLDAVSVWVRMREIIEEKLRIARSQDGEHWRIAHACPACFNKLPTEDQTVTMQNIHVCADANFSLKRLEKAGQQDYRLHQRRYFIDEDRVDDMARVVGTSTVGGDCDANNWGAARANAGEDHVGRRTWDAFDRNGIATVNCQHGVPLLAADIIKSGELAKYPLALLRDFMDAVEGPIAFGYDIACSFSRTVAASGAFSSEEKRRLTFVIGAFHAHAHNWWCQIDYHPRRVPSFGLSDFEAAERLYSNTNHLASSTRTASQATREIRIERRFSHIATEKVAALGTYLLSNLKQAQTTLAEAAVTLSRFDLADVQEWETAEKAWFRANPKSSFGSREEDDEATYVSLLLERTALKEEHRVLTDRWIPYQPSAPGPTPAERARSKRVDIVLAELTGVESRLVNLRWVLGLSVDWSPTDEKWVAALKRKGRASALAAMTELEKHARLRAFEMERAGLPFTGVKLRTKIALAVKSRSAAFYRALERFNALAQASGGELAVLSAESAMDESSFASSVLYQGRVSQEWAQPSAREAVRAWQHQQCAALELRRVAQEASRVEDWIEKEYEGLRSLVQRFKESGDPLLSEAERLLDVHELIVGRLDGPLHSLRLHLSSADADEPGIGRPAVPAASAAQTGSTPSTSSDEDEAAAGSGGSDGSFDGDAEEGEEDDLIAHVAAALSI